MSISMLENKSYFIVPMSHCHFCHFQDVCLILKYFLCVRADIAGDEGIYYGKIYSHVPAYSRNVTIYIYIYIVIHRQTVLLYHNSSVWLDMLDTSS